MRTPYPVSSNLRAGEVAPLDNNMVELALLLPAWQAEALENAAEEQGISAGQMLRRLIGDFCNRQSPCPRLRLGTSLGD
jgi:hypothetical protein